MLFRSATRAVTLTNPEGVKTTYVPSKLPKGQPKMFLIQAPDIGQVYVVSEYPEVFPEELPGMPPDIAIEFAIEVVPGATPSFKKHYGMTSPELAELKKQLDELLEKKFIRPSTSPWERRFSLSRSQTAA